MWKYALALILLSCIVNSCSSGPASVKSDSAVSDSVRTTVSAASVVADTLKGADRFIGFWGKDSTSDLSEGLKVDEDTSIFGVVSNQLGVMCRNKFKGDTLLLYVISTDQGRGFMGPKYYPPKPKSLFAKCYVADSGLVIIYTQEMFSKNIEDLELNTLLHKFD